MNEPIKKFSMRVVLTVITGRLLTKSCGEHDSGISDLYEILGHMTGDSPFTHQLSRFVRECKPWLLRWYPALDSPELKVEVDKLILMLGAKSGIDSPEMLIKGWLSSLITEGICNEKYDVGRIPQDDHDVKNPYDELVVMRGTDEGIILVAKEKE